MPIHHIEGATSRSFGPHPTSKRRCRFSRRRIARFPQLPMLPAADHAKFDLVPIAFHNGAVEMSIAIAHHHAIGFNHQAAGCWSVLIGWWFMCAFNVRYGCALLTFEFGSDGLGVRPQRFAPYLHACQFIQQARRLTKRGDRPQRRQPVRQSRTCLLVWRQLERLVGWAPTVPTAPAVVPPPLQSDRAQACLDTPSALRLDATSLLASRTPRGDASRVLLESSGRQLHNRFQQRRRRRTPGGQHTLFVLGQAVIPMCSRMLQHRSTQVHQRLYDLIREVVQVHVASPDPPLSQASAGLLL